MARERTIVLSVFGVALIAALIFIQNYNHLYWLYVFLATATIGIAAIFARRHWQDRATYEPYYAQLSLLFLLLGVFWLVAWFWFADDFCPDYWGTVLLNAAYCAALCTAFYWLDGWRPSARPYAICFGLGLAVTCIILMYQGHCLMFLDFERNFEFGSYYFVPFMTASCGTLFALIWFLILRRPFQWWMRRKRVIRNCPNNHKVRLPPGKTGTVICPVCKTSFSTAT